MIVCPNCSKENQDHYKFCLGCGLDLPRKAGDAKPLSTATPPAGIAAAQMPEAQASTTAPQEAVDQTKNEVQDVPPVTAEPDNTATEPAPEPAPEPEVSARICATCNTPIPPGFAFCGACGTPIAGSPKASSASEVQQQETPVSKPSAALILIQPDGSEGGMVEIPETEVAVGRAAGGFFETDAYLSPKHAIFKASNGKIEVRDEGGLNGVFKKVMPNNPIEIKSGDVFRMGQELVLFEEIDKGTTAPDGTKHMGSPIEGLWAKISLIVGQGKLGNSFPVGGEGVICGRERGNILFPEDGYISGVHLRIHSENGHYYLTDLGSSNGTYIKLNTQTALSDGDFILMGAQLFRAQA